MVPHPLEIIRPPQPGIQSSLDVSEFRGGEDGEPTGHTALLEALRGTTHAQSSLIRFVAIGASTAEQHTVQ